MKNNSIICGFAGIGKSHTAKEVAGVVDLESTPFKKNWELYVDVAMHMQKNGYKVLMSCHKELREELKKRGADYFVVLPSILDKENYLKRYRDRVDTEQFIKLFEENWEKFIEELEKEEPRRVTLKIKSHLRYIDY